MLTVERGRHTTGIQPGEIYLPCIQLLSCSPAARVAADTNEAQCAMGHSKRTDADSYSSGASHEAVQHLQWHLSTAGSR